MATIIDSHIETTPDVRGGRPRIAGTRISVDDIVIMHLHLGQSLEQIAGKYALGPAAVHAAMTYYYDNQSVVDKQIADDDAFIEAFKMSNPSKLQQKLQALNRG